MRPPQLQIADYRADGSMLKLDLKIQEEILSRDPVASDEPRLQFPSNGNIWDNFPVFWSERVMA